VVEYPGVDAWTKRFHIYVPGARDAERTVIIRYRVRNAIRFFFKSSDVGELDELYWNVTGNAWTMPIDSVHATIVLPQGVRPTQTAVYTGPEGAHGTDGRIEQHENEVEFNSTRGFYPYEGMTVAAGWPAGAIAGRPSQTGAALMEALRWTPLFIPLLVLGFAYRRWDKKGRDPAEGSYVVRYEPVPGKTPAELGTLVDHDVDIQDITSTLVDLAVRGYIHITELTEEHFFGLSKSTDYRIDIVKRRSEWNGLKPHEVSYLDALGQSAPSDTYSVKVSDLKNSFYRFLPEIRNAIYDVLVEAGYYRERPDMAKAKSIGIAVAITFVLGGITILSLARGVVMFAPAALVAATILSLIILIGFALIMPARTVEGAHAREAALGFQEFLSRVEEDRFRRMITSPDLFEKYLPYAMAFGVDENWARAFRDMHLPPPQWYTGTTGGHFDVSGFSHSISSMSQAAASSMTSSPSSSGSGGGGSSGGGSGGGGGSGF